MLLRAGSRRDAAWIGGGVGVAEALAAGGMAALQRVLQVAGLDVLAAEEQFGSEKTAHLGDAGIAVGVNVWQQMLLSTEYWEVRAEGRLYGTRGPVNKGAGEEMGTVECCEAIAE